ncbi:MAG: hypothetical protein GYA33_12290 [Thermogutta sp.]|nr:hypothetical protein [Thermogutta sp.]
MTCRIELRYGSLDVNRFVAGLPPGTRVAAVHAAVDEQETPVTTSAAGGRLVLEFSQPLRLEADHRLVVKVRLEEVGR